MTTVIAALGKDFVVLGADSQGTIDAGARTEIKDLIKLKKINDNTSMLYFGDVNSAEYLIHKFKSILKKKNYNVTKIANDFKIMCIEEAEQHRSVQAKLIPEVGFIIAGLDKVDKTITPHCYSTNSWSGFRLGKYPSGYGIGGKPFIAHYLFRRSYSQNMTLDEICKLVGQSIYDTKKVDGDVGGEIRLAVIDSSGFREIPVADVYNYYIETWNN